MMTMMKRRRKMRSLVIEGAIMLSKFLRRVDLKDLAKSSEEELTRLFTRELITTQAGRSLGM